MLNAIVLRNAEEVERLIGDGVDVNALLPASIKLSGLFVAVHCGFMEGTRLLLEAKADVNKAEGKGWTPLHVASLKGRAEFVRVLIEHGADVDRKDVLSGAVPLNFAARVGDFRSLEFLLLAKAQVDVGDLRNDTPLCVAIQFSFPACAELLLDAGSKMRNVREGIEIPDWMTTIVTKRKNVTQSTFAFIAALRKRFTVERAGMEHMGNRVPRDLVTLLVTSVWRTRLNPRWMSEAATATTHPRQSPG